MHAPNRLSIIHHNVQTWSTKKAQLQHIYSRFSPDLILLNEIHHTNMKNPTPVKIPGYAVYTKSNGIGGTAICIKSSIKHKPMDDFESQLQAVNIATKQGELIIATDYIPPSRDYVIFPDYIKLFRRQQPTYLFADLNARHPAFGYQSTSITGKNIAHLLHQNIIKHIGPSFPTRIDHKASRNPDIVLSNQQAFHNIHLQQGPATSSDHLPIIATISAYPISIPIKPRKQFAKANWTRYSEELLDIPPPPTHLLSPQEIDQLTEDWTNQIVQAGDKHIPTLTHRVIPGLQPGHDILTLEKEIEMYQNILSSLGPHRLTYSLLITARTQLNTLYWNLHNRSWDKAITEMDLERDPQKFFRSVKKMSGNSKTATQLHLRDANNQILAEPADQEEVFRKYWSRIFRNDQEDHLFDQNNIDTVNNHIENENNLTKPLPQADPAPFSPEFPQMTTKHITDSFAKLKPRAPGFSGITSHHLKHLPPNMILTFKTICNQSLASGYIPKIWKHAIIILIPKGKKSQFKVEDHRPISLLETPGKVLDRFINTTLVTILDNKQLHHPDQHGFRKFRGTHTALATFHETIANSARTKSSTTTVTLRDVSKAFDKVWTDGLKYKTLHLPLPDPLKRIICNFVTDRTAAIRVKDHIGPTFPLLSGVPQGACLSPSLYNLYTSALPTTLPANQSKLGKLQNILYADDISQITTTTVQRQHHQRHTSRAIQYVNDYESQWKIKTNTNKFQAISLLKPPKKTLQVNNQPIPTSKIGKTLGLSFNRAGYGPQCVQNKGKCGTKLSNLRRFAKLSARNKLRLYKSIILPSLIYPTVPLHTVPKTHMRKLQSIQNQALYFALKTHPNERPTAETLHNRANIEPINVMLHRHAKTTWSTIQNHHPQLYAKLANQYRHTSHRVRFPSSRLLAEGPPPPPTYVYRGRRHHLEHN